MVKPAKGQRVDVKIYPLRYSKGELGQIPEQERLLHLMAGHFLNDLHFLARLAIVSISGVEAPTPSGRASLGMTAMLIRQLAGRAYEAGLLLKHKAFRDVIDAYR